ncbi:helix-turn-helix domain-containing protein [Lactococcus lactis]|uniref:helix-turn-helix domain-containing protein n=1 Tax=Lactococcus lactis TaxID=1358 RepID=UPI003D0CC293
MATNRLKEILDSKKMSFSELKKLLGEKDVKVNNSQLSLYSSGRRNPKNKKIWVIISEVLNIELQEIITDINAYLTIMAEISENSSEKKEGIENNLSNKMCCYQFLG